MSGWIDVDAVTVLPEGSISLVEVAGDEVALFNIDGRFYAIEDKCSHDGGTLADGTVEGFEIECPRHGARFDLRTGRVTAPPAFEDIRTYAVRVNDGRVQIRDDAVSSHGPPDE